MALTVFRTAIKICRKTNPPLSCGPELNLSFPEESFDGLPVACNFLVYRVLVLQE
jgi:hypothetical protein